MIVDLKSHRGDLSHFNSKCVSQSDCHWNCPLFQQQGDTLVNVPTTEKLNPQVISGPEIPAAQIFRNCIIERFVYLQL